MPNRTRRPNPSFTNENRRKENQRIRYTIYGEPVFGESAIDCWLPIVCPGHGDSWTPAAVRASIGARKIDPAFLFDSKEEARDACITATWNTLSQELQGVYIESANEFVTCFPTKEAKEAYAVALRHLRGRGWPTDERVRVCFEQHGLTIPDGFSDPLAKPEPKPLVPPPTPEYRLQTTLGTFITIAAPCLADALRIAKADGYTILDME